MKYKFSEAIKHVESFILTATNSKSDTKCSVYTYQNDERKREWAGVLVDEVSVYNERGGYSWMQSDLPHGLAVCAQVERCLLALIEDWGFGVDEDGAEEFDKLKSLLI